MLFAISAAALQRAQATAMSFPTEAWKTKTFVADEFPVDVYTAAGDVAVDVYTATDMISGIKLGDMAGPPVHASVNLLPIDFCLAEHVKFSVLSACFIGLWFVLVRVALLGRK